METFATSSVKRIAMFAWRNLAVTAMISTALVLSVLLSNDVVVDYVRHVKFPPQASAAYVSTCIGFGLLFLGALISMFHMLCILWVYVFRVRLERDEMLEIIRCRPHPWLLKTGEHWINKVHNG